jgi:hypothetical protein
MAVDDVTSTLVSDVYEQVCDALLEDGGLQLGILSDDGFLDIFASVYTQFCALGGLSKRAAIVRAIAGQQSYVYPDWMAQVTDVEYDLRGLRESDSQGVEMSRYGFEFGLRRDPETWVRDQMEVKHIKVFPAPRASGPVGENAARNFRLWGTEIPDVSALSLESPIGLVPNSLTPYLKWGTLERIHLINGELRDTAKAAYCLARWNEGLNLCRAVTGQGAMDAR